MTELPNTIQLRVGELPDPIILIDKNGFHYRGQFIEDAGEAHRLLVDFLRSHQPDTDWRHADD